MTQSAPLAAMPDRPQTENRTDNDNIRRHPYRMVLDRLSPNQGAEILRYGWRNPDILSLGQGEGDCRTPDFIVDAAHAAMKEGMTFYGPVLGHPALREELSGYYRSIYGLEIPAGRIFVTGSGTTGIHLALTAILDEGDDVLTVTPIWKNLMGAIELAQARNIQVPLEHTEKGWRLDLDKLFSAATPRTKAIMIVSPSNPTGWIASEDEIRAILEFSRKRGIWIVADEIYGRIVYDRPRAPSFLDYADEHDLLMVVGSFSKTWAMTGWRIGWVVGPDSAEQRIRDLALYDNLGPNSFGQFGAIAALRHGEGFIQDQLILWRSNRDLMMDRLRQTGRVRITEPQATFYAFFKVDGEPDCMALARRLIDEVGLSLAPGCAFGRNCAGFMRIHFAASEAKMLEALDRFERALK